jgi:hypothetical protein
MSSAQVGINYAGGTSTKLDYTFLSQSTNNDDQIKGSKYLNDDFARGQISDFNDKIFAIRYDIYNDQMEFQAGDGQIYVMNKNNVSREIVFLDSKTRYKLFDYISDEGNTKSGYFSILKSLGKYKILKKNRIIFIEAKESSTGYDAPHPATYKKTKNRHYIVFDNAPGVLIDTNKKKFSSLFKGQEKDVLNFIKKNKIKLSVDDDLIKVLNYLNPK